ncbi:acyltransferase [Baekduia soli]|uniref:Acyltransferase n=1 Tax=Baekduia soli TaxID=496014 RepID=A0A5B8U9T6_9ACTN|nr:acyltransferase [Baekduia soli]QEC49568.1 acyltransferase [Baekduia soli]
MAGHKHAGALSPELTPDALRPPPGNPRFPLVDGLRAVAALCVVVTHTAFISGFNGHGELGAITARLDVGVALFFVISGFLLYRPFVAARHLARPAPRVLLYFRRRALRILPAYWLALTVLAIWPGLLLVHSGTWWVYYGFLQDLRVPWIEGGITAAWSLCVEVQFYLLLPLYALACARWLSGRSSAVQARAEAGALVFLAALSLLTRTLFFDDPAPDTVANTIAGTFTWFALGMGTAVLSVRWHATPVAQRPVPLRVLARRPGAAWVLSALLLLLVTRIGMPTVTITGYDGRDWFFGHVLYGAIALCFAAPAMLGDPARGGVPGRVLGWRPVAWLGLVSYGIFLWHQPLTGKFIGVQDWTTHGSFIVYTLVVAGVATGFATLSYYLVERPLLRFKDPPARSPGRTPGGDPSEITRDEPPRTVLGIQPPTESLEGRVGRP